MKTAILALGVALLGLVACHDNSKPADDGPQTTQDRNVPAAGATGIDVSAPLNLHIRIGDEPSCRLKGPARLLSRLKTEMDGSTFRIFTDSKMNWNSNETTEAWVTIPHLQSLHTAGAGDIVIDSRIEENSINMDLSGAVDVDIAGIETGSFRLDLSGAGDVLVRSGVARMAQMTIAGTGNIDAFELKTQDASVSVTGAGRAALTATERLNADISGTGMIRYKGSPAIEKSISGIGTLQNAN